MIALFILLLLVIVIGILFFKNFYVSNKTGLVIISMPYEARNLYDTVYESIRFNMKHNWHEQNNEYEYKLPIQIRSSFYPENRQYIDIRFRNNNIVYYVYSYNYPNISLVKPLPNTTEDNTNINYFKLMKSV